MNPILNVHYFKKKKALQEKYPWFCINEPVKSDDDSVCSTKTGVSSGSSVSS